MDHLCKDFYISRGASLCTPVLHRTLIQFTAPWDKVINTGT